MYGNFMKKDKKYRARGWGWGGGGGVLTFRMDWFMVHIGLSVLS